MKEVIIFLLILFTLSVSQDSKIVMTIKYRGTLTEAIDLTETWLKYSGYQTVEITTITNTDNYKITGFRHE